MSFNPSGAQSQRPMPKKPPKNLIAQWDKKLKESGFHDIESRATGQLTDWHHWYFQERYTIEEYAAKARYYELATQLLYEYPFVNNRERKIWEMHANGAVIHDIAKAVGLSYQPVHRIVARIAACIKYS